MPLSPWKEYRTKRPISAHIWPTRAQSGFCSPGLIMNIIAMTRELKNPTEDEIRAYLAGNLCRCTGYVGQLRAIRTYLAAKEEG